MRARRLGWNKIKNSEYRFTTVIGIDISKNRIDIADNRNSAAQSVANSKPKIDEWIKSIANQSNVIVLMEATGDTNHCLSHDCIKTTARWLLSIRDRCGTLPEALDAMKKQIRSMLRSS